MKNTVTGTTVTFTNMQAGDYVYEVHSFSNLFGESAEGTTVSLTVGSVTMTPPATFTASSKTLTDIVLTWTVASNATSYNIYQVIGDQKVLKSTVTGTTVDYLICLQVIMFTRFILLAPVLGSLPKESKLP